MFQLTIKKADGTVYWRQAFNSLAELNFWLDQEKTRAYWHADFTTEILDKTPAPPTAEELAARQALKLQIKTLKDRIKVLAAQSDLTAADMKEAIIKIIKLSVLLN